MNAASFTDDGVTFAARSASALRLSPVIANALDAFDLFAALRRAAQFEVLEFFDALFYIQHRGIFLYVESSLEFYSPSVFAFMASS